MRILIPAGGRGTRSLPATKALAKEMLPIIDRPLLQYLIEQARQAGIDSATVIISPDKKEITRHFQRNLELEKVLLKKKSADLLSEVQNINTLNVRFAVQKLPRGDGDALLSARSHLKPKEAFVVQFGDTLFAETSKVLKDMLKLHAKTGCSVVGVKEVKPAEVSKYGIVAVQKDKLGQRVINLVEKPSLKEAPSRLALTGVYILTGSIWNELKKAPAGKDGELRLADGLIQLMQKEPVYAYSIQSDWLDTGNFLGYLQANLRIAKADKRFGKQVRAILKSEA